jgi:hypothetical protein
MKKLLFAALIGMLAAGSVAAQTTPVQEKTCLEKWQDAFKKRGADAIGDGMHRNVIVSITDKEGTECFVGKARVELNKVNSIFVLLEDETYELFEPDQFKEKAPRKIENGVSEAWVSNDNRTFRVVFIEKLKPKAKEFKKAPDPGDL